MKNYVCECDLKGKLIFLVWVHESVILDEHLCHLYLGRWKTYLEAPVCLITIIDGQTLCYANGAGVIDESEMHFDELILREVI